MGELKGDMAKWKLKDLDRVQGYRSGGDQEGEYEHDGSDPGASPTTPFAFGTPGRRSLNVRSQSMNGRIQKPSVVRSQSFNGSKCSKLAHRSHHIDSMQGQLLNYMKSSGVDQQKVVHVLEKLKEMYLSQSELQKQLDQGGMNGAINGGMNGGLRASRPSSRPSSPPSSNYSGSKASTRLDDSPRSTITLLKHKFEQLERYKESIQGQQIPLYQCQNYRGQSGASCTPGSSNPGSPLVAPHDSYYIFDEPMAANLKRQELFSASPRSGTSGISEDSFREHIGSSSDSSPTSVHGDDAANALLHYMLQPPSPHWHNVAALNPQSGVDKVMGTLSSTQSDNVCLGGLLMAERQESQRAMMLAERAESQRSMLKTSTAAPDIAVRKTNLSASIEKAMAKFPFNLSVKRSTSKLKLSGSWGTGLSLNPQSAVETSGRESDFTGRLKNEADGKFDDWRKHPHLKNSEESFPVHMDLDTSLHL